MNDEDAVTHEPSPDVPPTGEVLATPDPVAAAPAGDPVAEGPATAAPATSSEPEAGASESLIDGPDPRVETGHEAGADTLAGTPLDGMLPEGPARDTVTQALDLLTVGGPVVLVLAGMSVVALAIVLLKLWQFRAARLGQTRVARDALVLYTAGRAQEAMTVAGRCRNPVAQALARAMRGQSRGLPEHKVREEVVRVGADALHSLRSWFRALEVIASLAPLLGLFGTVLGMIEAFRQLEAAGNQVNPAILSGGIWEALLTTAVGLAVAMPVIVVLNWLERRVDRVAHEMESVVTRVFTEDLSQDPPHGTPYANEDVRHEPPRRVVRTDAIAARV
ncbi:MotA/TolQ/ExbB proton channel family protein [Roseospira visakhapatnamensis]|uniref:Biopolymer transport protein ExbB n=1 Tax=Roseospira visakhapatnamensis TaxID=390880 RepID=A0A7W6WB06_9PROT|nr:MotA/TolQ/ExbB proton channel family protein [Roseospira visakhapatnamensis]MBB4267047.1 biopolymer transport protein ExbB [Roseospira visakhapatnamensis]